MQWDASPNAGFTSGEPWLPLAEDLREVNVAAQREDADSMLALQRRLLALRRAKPALATGAYGAVAAEGDVLAYVRGTDEGRFLIVLKRVE